MQHMRVGALQRHGIAHQVQERMYGHYATWALGPTFDLQ